MKHITAGLKHTAQAVAAAMMAVMFLTFVLQIFIRYSARLDWLPDYLPFLEPTRFGWTLELCLVLWLWLVFWGNAFVVRESDHVRFDILYSRVSPQTRRLFVIVFGLCIAIGLAVSIEPTWAKFYILRLKKTATLSSLFGDWIRMRDLYVVYMLFLGAVSARYFWIVWQAFRHGVPEPSDPDGERQSE
ncbi:TRAP transporter small permease subunit [uncultured Roseibium sp.]|uniref:TRAP transporter small permease subunit n=1 Tax=uncultured Roseibium sp. TaxID=1936171 RepID=UPI00262F9E10|nr:TRAP transporter small permease subunit [uncultured Roseibium sp.]